MIGAPASKRTERVKREVERLVVDIAQHEFDVRRQQCARDRSDVATSATANRQDAGAAVGSATGREDRLSLERHLVPMLSGNGAAQRQFFQRVRHRVWQRPILRGAQVLDGLEVPGDSPSASSAPAR